MFILQLTEEKDFLRDDRESQHQPQKTKPEVHRQQQKQQQGFQQEYSSRFATRQPEPTVVQVPNQSPQVILLVG